PRFNGEAVAFADLQSRARWNFDAALSAVDEECPADLAVGKTRAFAQHRAWIEAAQVACVILARPPTHEALGGGSCRGNWNHAQTGFPASNHRNWIRHED